MSKASAVYTTLQGEGLQHFRFTPPAALQEYVEHIWTLGVDTGPKIRREILVPNGRPGLIMCIGRPGVRTDSLSGQAHSNATIYYSVATRPFVIEQQGDARYIGLELKPYGLAAFTRDRYRANNIGHLGDLFGTASVEELLAALRSQGSPSLAVEHAATFLAERVCPVSPRNLKRIAASVALIQERDGIIKTAELAREMDISPSTLRRLFGRYIGTSPEQFIGVVRYACFVKSLVQPKPAPHILAALHGYYDEAHATKDFKKYTGLNKKAFLSTYDGLARIMHEND